MWVQYYKNKSKYSKIKVFGLTLSVAHASEILKATTTKNRAIKRIYSSSKLIYNTRMRPKAVRFAMGTRRN